MATQMTQKALRTNVYKGAERIAERDWQPIYKLVVRHGPQQITEHLAVPHYTKEKTWVLPGGIEATGDELVENGAHYTTTLLWPRYWTNHGKQS